MIKEEAKRQEPCDDAIIEWKKDFKGYVNSLSMPRDDYNGIMEYIDELPVTPQPTRPFRKFTDLSKDEIKQIVTDIFHPKKITNIETHKRDEAITCTIYTEWESYDDDGKLEIDLIPDALTLRNPFEYGDNAIHVGFSLGYDDYLKLKQFCFAKGIIHEDWIKYNPYLQEEEKSTEKQTDFEQIQDEEDLER